MRANHPHWFAKIIAHNPDWLQQVGVVTYDYRHVIQSLMTIMNHVCGDIDIRPFLFGFNNINEFLAVGQRIGAHHTHSAL